MEQEGNRRSGGPILSGVTPLSVAAHELKSPLVLLRQLSLDLEHALDETERDRIITQMVQITEKGLRLTSDLTRSEALQPSLFERSPVNPLSVCEDVTYELKRMYSAHDRSLKIRRIRQLPPVIANRDLLRRILLNFADNALHYADINGVVELQGQLIRERNLVRLSVRDYGPYLSSSKWDSLKKTLGSKQPVHQRPQSSGLGLYISHQFAEAMDASIGAIRHKDGASFYVELPASRQMSLL
jgi:signal transduction histidine kinase